MKHLLRIISIICLLSLISCNGKKDEGSYSLDSRLIGHTWSFSDGTYIYSLNFEGGNNIKYGEFTSGFPVNYWNYQAIPTGVNSFDIQSKDGYQHWEYSIEDDELQLCIDGGCDVFIRQ